jgi:hypothetical protein
MVDLVVDLDGVADGGDELAFMSMLLELCYWWSSRVGEDKLGSKGVG